MTDDQVRIFAETMANVPAALKKIDPELSAAIEADQEEVAEAVRQARSNGEILDQRIGGLAVGVS